jgi:hypothetical protein
MRATLGSSDHETHNAHDPRRHRPSDVTKELPMYLLRHMRFDGLAGVLVASAIFAFAGVGPASAWVGEDENDGSACLPRDCQPPVAPEGFRIVTGTNTSLSLEWTFIHGDASSLRRRQLPNGPWFELQHISQPAIGPTTYLDSGLTPETGYCYQVAAITELGTTVLEGASVACGVPADSPPSAGSVSASAVGPDKIDVTWNDTAADEQEARLERREQSGSAWTVVARYGISGRGTVVHRDSGLEPETTYCYRVGAWNFHGGGYGNEACARTLALPQLGFACVGCDGPTPTPVPMPTPQRSETVVLGESPPGDRHNRRGTSVWAPSGATITSVTNASTDIWGRPIAITLTHSAPRTAQLGAGASTSAFNALLARATWTAFVPNISAVFLDPSPPPSVGPEGAVSRPARIAVVVTW